MPLYDYHCENCGTFETIKGIEEREITCPNCGESAIRKLNIGRINCANDDADWIRGAVKGLIDPDSKNSDDLKLKRYPTRTNLNEYCKAKGLRPVESGDLKKRPKQELDVRKHADKLAKRHQERSAIKLNG